MKNRMITLLFVAGMAVFPGLILFPIPAEGQIENHLILKKNGYLNKLHFLTGDPITLIRQGNKYPEEFYIQGIGSDFIVVSGDMIPIKDIAFLIHYRTGFNFVSSGTVLMIASPVYLVIGAVNELFRRSSPVPTLTNLIVAGALLTTGIIFRGLQVRKFPIGKKFTLKIVQSDPALNR